jgi:hypothetical protein
VGQCETAPQCQGGRDGKNRRQGAVAGVGRFDHRVGLCCGWDRCGRSGDDQRPQQEGEEADEEIAKSEIKKAAPGLSVASADSANKLDGLDADGLIRTAFSSVADAPDANGTVLTTTIQAPEPGFLTIIASLDVVYGPGDDQLECLLQTDEANIPNSLRGLNVAGTVNADTDCVPTITQQVGAGAHKVDLEVTNRKDATFGAGSLSVIFTPFNATGGTG